MHPSTYLDALPKRDPIAQFFAFESIVPTTTDDACDAA